MSTTPAKDRITAAKKNDVVEPAFDTADPTNMDLKRNAHNTVGLAVLQQQELIPTTGERKVSTKWEYWTYCVFCGYRIRSMLT